MKLEIRKTIAIVCVAVLSLVVLTVLWTGKELPPSIDAIITAFIGFIGYYFGKSTALDVSKKDGGE